MFPEQWKRGVYTATATPVTPALGDRMSAVVVAEERMFPDAFLTNTLSRIYLVDRLFLGSVECSGPNSRSAIYIAADGMDEHFDREIAATFHHELASILLRNYRDAFDSFNWTRANPPGFAYVGGSVLAVALSHAGLSYSPELCEQGFVFEYSKACIEADFIDVADQLFVGSKELWDAADKYPRIARKVDITIQFYHKMHSGFTREYFRGLAGRDGHVGRTW